MLLCTLASLGAMPTAGASPYGYDAEYPNWNDGGPDIFPDDAEHSYCFYNIPSGYDQTRIHEANEYLDQFSVMWDAYGNGSCQAWTDVVWAYSDPIWELPGAYGWYDCKDRTGWMDLFCENALVQVDQHVIDEAAPTYAEYNFNLHIAVRHENGHSVGLAHHYPFSNADAMIVAHVTNLSNWNYLSYASHEATCHINPLFGYGTAC